MALSNQHLWAHPTDLRCLVDNFPYPILVLDRNQKVVFLTVKAMQFLSVRPDDIIDSSPPESPEAEIWTDPTGASHTLLRTPILWEGNPAQLIVLVPSPPSPVDNAEQNQGDVSSCAISSHSISPEETQDQETGLQQLCHTLQIELEKRTAQLQEVQAHLDRVLQEAEEAARRKEGYDPNSITLPTLRYGETRNDLSDLERFAFQDPITGLGNYNLLQELLRKLEKQFHKQDNATLAVLIIDIDRFHLINDLFGHEGGNHLLDQIAAKLQEIVQPPHALCRRGEDEFIIVCYHAPKHNHDNIRASHQARALAQQILKRCRGPYDIRGEKFNLELSIGMSAYPGHVSQIDQLIPCADQAVRKAKACGGGRLYIYTEELKRQLKQRIELITSLRQAMSQGEFAVYYQPIIELKRGKVVGLEALLRWPRSDELILPAGFLEAAEEAGILTLLGDWVITRACQLAARLKHQFVSINLSPRQFMSPYFVKRFMEQIHISRIKPNRIIVEIPEGTDCLDTKRVEPVLEELTHWGVGLGIDDVGTGATSFKAVNSRNLQFMKLDLSLVDGLPNDTQSGNICKAVISLAHSLGTKALAEGVETAQQLKTLKSYGCDLAQGYYFCEPLPYAEALEVARKQFKV